MTVEAATQILEGLSLSADEKFQDSKVMDLSGAKGAANGKRRRPWAPRTIPREYLASKDSNRPRPQRRRTKSETSPRQLRRSARSRTTSEMSTVSEPPSKEAQPMKKLRDTVMEKFDKKGSNMLASYLKNRRELTTFESKTKFLQQCKAVEVVPVPYRLTNFNIKNTKVIRRILDKFSLQTMFAVLIHCRKRCEQIKRLLADRADAMTELFGEELAKEIVTLADQASERRAQQLHERNAENFNSLVSEYKLSEEDIKIGEDRLKLFEQLDKERQERRLMRLREKPAEDRSEAKPTNEGNSGSKSKDGEEESVKSKDGEEESVKSKDGEKEESEGDKKAQE